MKTRAILWNDRDDELVFAGPFVDENEDPEEALNKALEESGQIYLADEYPVLTQDEDDNLKDYRKYTIVKIK